MTNKSIRDYINLIEDAQREGVAEGSEQKKPLKTHKSGCGYNYGHDCNCGGTLTHASNCHYNYGHDCDCGLDRLKQQKQNKQQGVAEGLPQTLRKVVPGHAKREIDKKMDAGKFGKTDADKDANFQRYKKIQDKLKEQGVAEEQLEETSPEAIAKINQITRK